jgi:flagellar biosynthetic protein FliS
MKEKARILENREPSERCNDRISSVSRKDQIVSLYNCAVNLLRQALKYLNENKPAEFTDSIESTRQIFYHLYETLDFNQEGGITRHLGALYTYIIGQLYIVNATKNDKIISDLLVIINNLKEGWEASNPEDISKGILKNGALQAGKQTVVSTKV